MIRVVTVPAEAYPNLRQMAEMLRVAKSTLSQRKPDFERVANEKHYAPRTVLALGGYYRHRPLPDVAQELIQHAREVVDEVTARKVQSEVEVALAAAEERPAAVKLDELSLQFDLLLERMQAGDAGRRIRDAFASVTPLQMGQAAVRAARHRRRAIDA